MGREMEEREREEARKDRDERGRLLFTHSFLSTAIFMHTF